MRIPVYEVVVGESLPDLSLWVEVNGLLQSDYSTNASFQLTVYNPDDDTVVLFTKFVGFVGQPGSGTEQNGVPNLVIQWFNVGELDQLIPGRSHRALLQITRLSDNKISYFEFIIKAIGRPG